MNPQQTTNAYFDETFFDQPEFRPTLLRYADDERITKGEARRHFIAIAQYLTVAARASDPVSPSRGLDRPWHAFLCSTRCYRQFCERSFGRFIEHAPYAPGEERPEQYLRAREMARELFGESARWAYLQNTDDDDGGDCG